MRVLIVEDNPESAYLLEQLLKSAGYETITAPNGAEALKLAGAGRLDLVVSDIYMPVMDGFQLCQKLKSDAKTRNIPLIFYTAEYTEKRDEELGLKIGADLYLVKNGEGAELVGAARRLIADAQAGKLRGRAPEKGEEKELCEFYSERLIRKLEQRTRELEGAETLLNAIIEDIPVPLWIADPTGLVIRQNQAQRDLIKAGDREIIGKYNVLKDSQAERQGLMPLIKSVFENKKTVSFEFDYNTGAEKQIEIQPAQLSLEVVLAPVCDRNGQLLNVICLQKEISERRRAERELKNQLREMEDFYHLAVGRELKMIELERDNRNKKAEIDRVAEDVKHTQQQLMTTELRYKMLIENLNDVIFSVDTKGTIVYVSPAVKEMLGYLPEELFGHNFSEYIHPEDLPGLQNSFASTLAGKLSPAEFRIFKKGGVFCRVRTSSRPLLLDGKPFGITGVMIDLSRLKS